MIGFLKGHVKELSGRVCLLDVHDVGYEVFVPDGISVLDGEMLELYTYTHVREDILQLYGFQTREQKKFFELLLSVNGIGPKSGLEIMSQSLGMIVSAVREEDVSLLTKIPGIGKKTAERMLIDLRGKVDSFSFGQDTNNGQLISKGPLLKIETHFQDVIQALEALGYDRRSIIPTLQTMHDGKGPQREDTEELIIKYCLQHL